MPVAHPNRTWLNAAVGSVLDDLGPVGELVVVDDGCDPPVAELLDRADDKRLTVLRTDARGVAHARNTGLAAVRGDHVRFADADDVLEPGSTAFLLALAADGSISYGSTLVCDESLEPQRVLASDLEGRADEACLLGQFDVRLPALLFPRAVAEAAGSWDPAFAVCSDWDFVLRALEHAPVRGSQEIAVRYRRHAASLTRTVSLDSVEAAWRRVVDGFFARHPERRGTELERRAQTMLALHWAEAYAYRRDGRWLSRLATALRPDPRAALLRLPRLLALAIRGSGRW